MGSNKGLKQKMQAMKSESSQAEEHVAYVMPTYQKDKHAPNRPSV
ncbi:hypothetical protein O9H85_07425 [Paenibacillus filicis]|uniref:Uncharacterized protein n=1 Tax=Paenibacillus gyeongsangnamensis TaxID=3388067 RepID=A0ABT4Q5V1_9BACL|nr:hypothetical protein [Paenibacillus filicis]MCZ8512259.1 hypothetical protein [Paenibacillus filicis]